MPTQTAEVKRQAKGIAVQGGRPGTPGQFPPKLQLHRTAPTQARSKTKVKIVGNPEPRPWQPQAAPRFKIPRTLPTLKVKGITEAHRVNGREVCMQYHGRP